MATGSSSDATTAIRLFASLLYGAKAMRVDSEKDRDPYWTNIGYYNSIRELGQAATWIRADIDQHLDVMYKRRFEDKRYPTKEEYRKNRRYIWRDEELTSRISGSEVTASLANLGIRYPGEVDSERKIKEHPIDICLATNMISVGLDVSRLGLMTVAGQPKTTSEYIQATSRVGRDAENAPGLVFVLYRPGRPRDKSHYDYILKAAGIQLSSEPVHQDSIDVLKDKLKLAVRDFYVEGNSSAIHRIESIASAIGRATSTSGKENEHTKSSRYSPTVSQVEKLSRLLDYCKTMRMSYSYKPILILALLHYGDRDGCISIENAAVYFREYYSNRKAQGLAIEKKQCIYLRDDVTDAQIIANLLSNPVKALIESGFFFYNEDAHVFSVSPDIWSTIDISNKAAITRICRQKLKDSYKD